MSTVTSLMILFSTFVAVSVVVVLMTLKLFLPYICHCVILHRVILKSAIKYSYTVIL